MADFILTHGDVQITEEDGTPLLETERGVLLYCNDMRFRDELMNELRKSEGFEDRHISIEYSYLRRFLFGK